MTISVRDDEVALIINALDKQASELEEKAKEIRERSRVLTEQLNRKP